MPLIDYSLGVIGENFWSCGNMQNVLTVCGGMSLTVIC